VKVLVLGGNGMLGHHFLLAWIGKHDIRVTLKNDSNYYAELGLFDNQNSFFNVDICNIHKVSMVIQEFRPEVVINATGVTKQIAGDRNVESVIEINALFPHKLAGLCKQFSVRLIQFSSDCIFSGVKGNYIESDISDAKDLYGKTKYLGEVDQSHVITLRKSTIGLELAGCHGLIEWFLAQRGEISGYRNAIYSGLISTELVRVVEIIILHHPSLSGVWNVASIPINKYDLLMQLQKRLELKTSVISADDKFICDRSLIGTRFEKQTGYKAPSWEDMLDELALEINARYLKKIQF